MTMFDDRERAAEASFARDEEMAFRITARRNRLLGQWAAAQMELVGHDFFVFRNAESGDVNVIYRRRDGNYGLIEPEL